jgi:hypothetical protein
MYQDEQKQLVELSRRFGYRIRALRTIVKKLSLYDRVPDGPPDAPVTIGAATWGRPPAAPSQVINVYGTVGTLNTGQVLGNIQSHVSSVTGSPSADAFREAVEELAKLIAQDGAFSDESRREILESIDLVAEEASRPPEKRRLGAVRAVLSALPGAIAISGGAIEAWDRYGPAIRAYLGL